MTAVLDEPVAGPDYGRTRRVLVAVIAVALAVLIGTGGWWLGSRSGGPSVPSSASVDAGFARDMATHHQQAVVMARYERLYTTNPNLQLLAYNIEDTQTYEMGQMQGWLDTWHLSRTDDGAPMSWMDGQMQMTSDDLMPGMATPAQMNRLTSLRGTAMDKLFLQLMIHHHQGGVEMAQYAAAHATEPYVRMLAQSMVTAQSDEIVQMEQTLRSLGGAPLPKP